jgi:hypothetical protein
MGGWVGGWVGGRCSTAAVGGWGGGDNAWTVPPGCLECRPGLDAHVYGAASLPPFLDTDPQWLCHMYHP